MTAQQICKYHKFDKDNWEHSCTELELVCMGNEKDQKYCYLCQRDKYKQALDEINSIVKHWYENEWSCYQCRINMDRQLKKILGLIRNLR